MKELGEIPLSSFTLPWSSWPSCWLFPGFLVNSSNCLMLESDANASDNASASAGDSAPGGVEVSDTGGANASVRAGAGTLPRAATWYLELHQYRIDTSISTIARATKQGPYIVLSAL